MDVRKAQEKAYHNERYTSEVRGKIDRIYAITTSIKNAYDRLLDRICRDKAVLEIGCAGGDRISQLASRGNRMTGIDISETAIDQAKRTAARYGTDRVDLRVMDAENLEFPNDLFDVVCGAGILHHLDIGRVYRELHRVLRPDGTAVFIEPLGHNPLINLFRRLTPSYRTESEHPLRMSDIRFAAEYFTDVSVQYYYLFSILSIPFSGTILLEPVKKTLETLDRAVFMLFPFTRRFAWMALIVLSRPQKHF